MKKKSSKQKPKEKSKKIVPIVGHSKKAVEPPPTRAEIVEALVLKLEREWSVKWNDWQNKAREAREMVETGIKDYLTTNAAVMMSKIKTNTMVLHQTRISMSIDVDTKDLPENVIKALEDHNKFNDRNNKDRPPNHFDKEGTRREMRQAMICDPARVRALADSKEIAETLAHIKENQEKPTPMLALTCDVMPMKGRFE